MVSCGGDDCDDANPAVYPGAPLTAPRPLRPQNGARTGSPHAAPAVGTLRPTFRWLGTGDCLGATSYELEMDDSCETPGFASCAFLSAELAVTGLAVTSYQPAADLPISVMAPVGRRYYWRIRACRGATCSEWSAVRYLDVGRAPGDLNGDGYSDLVVGSYLRDIFIWSEGAAFVYYGSATGIAETPSVELANPDPSLFYAFGGQIESAGDLNADGFCDLVVSVVADGE